MTQAITFAFISLFIIPMFVFAQAGSPVQGLPKAGITPESNFYFLDTLGETLREFFTFNSESKARLQITFAAERVAEIKIILETKGIAAKGLAVAQSRLQENIAKAAAIITRKKSKGEDISGLAKELDNKLETPKSVLADGFKEQKKVLETKEDELEAQIKAARRADDIVKVEVFVRELGRVKADQELLKLKKEDIEDGLEKEEEKIEEAMEVRYNAEKAIREAEEKKEEVFQEADQEGVVLPGDAFAKFEQLLAQAKELFVRENYQGAKQLARQAKEALRDTDEEKEKLKDAKEQQEEQMKEEEERQNEEEKEKAEQTKKDEERKREQEKQRQEEGK